MMNVMGLLSFFCAAGMHRCNLILLDSFLESHEDASMMHVRGVFSVAVFDLVAPSKVSRGSHGQHSFVVHLFVLFPSNVH